jgi:hypothetical protein
MDVIKSGLFLLNKTTQRYYTLSFFGLFTYALAIAKSVQLFHPEERT